MLGAQQYSLFKNDSSSEKSMVGNTWRRPLGSSLALFVTDAWPWKPRNRLIPPFSLLFTGSLLPFCSLGSALDQYNKCGPGGDYNVIYPGRTPQSGVLPELGTTAGLSQNPAPLWLEGTSHAPVRGWAPQHAAAGQSVWWEQIRSEPRGAFYQLLCSQRPDDLQGVA